MRRGGLAALALTFGAGVNAGGQTVMQVEGGGNSVTGGYGASLKFWTKQSEGWLGAGYHEGWRIGGYAKRIVGKDTIGAGSRMESLALPTDVFGSVPYVLTQGVDWQARKGATQWTLLGGVTGTGVGAPYVNTVRAERPVLAGLVQRRVSPSVTVTSRLFASARQSLFMGAHWRDPGSPHSAAATFGVGSNKPYAAVSAAGEYDRFEYRASFTGIAKGFRRADAPLPSLSEPYRENVVVTTRLTRNATVTVGRQNFRQDAVGVAPASTVRVHQVVGHAQRGMWNYSGGVFDARSPAIGTVSYFANVGRSLGSRLTGSVAMYSTKPDSGETSSSVMLTTRQTLSPRLSLLEVVSHTNGQTSAGLGGSFQSGFTSISVDYQTVYVPLRQPDPFVRTLALSVRLQLGRYSTNVASSLDQSGNVNYTASGSTFLYLGEFGAGAAPITIKFERFVVRGRVVHESGEPMEGAAIEAGTEFGVSNSQGDFVIRMPRPGELPLRVVLDEFTVPGDFEVVEAPATVNAQPEERAVPVRIVVRRKRIPVPPTAVPDSSARPSPAPADTMPRPRR